MWSELSRPFLKMKILTVFLGFSALPLASCTGSTQANEKSAANAMDELAAAEPTTCMGCHAKETPGIVAQYASSGHAENGIECIDCHEAEEGDLDAFMHEGERIATVVSPKDCSTCHEKEAEQFQASHHAKAGNILHSLDNLLAESVEGFRGEWEVPHPHKPGVKLKVNGLAFANSGCHQCHGSQVALVTKDGGSVTPWSLKQPEGGGKAQVSYDVSSVDLSSIARDEQGRPELDHKTWPNTGIGRMNLDGSRGSCTACHSRHDFSRRRARQPENCGKCHLGPDHPQKEIYEESKHGVAYRDLKDTLNLDNETWILGKDYYGAPTCATCHMSATKDLPVTHDPRERISWNNRPPKSVRLNTDAQGNTVKPGSGGKITSTWQDKRDTMKKVCGNCHSVRYVDGFYKQYDDFVMLYNKKYAEPGLAIMAAMKKEGLISKGNFDEPVEWTWFFIWHHEGRRARHGTSMMAPDYAHWHGTFEVAERWYNEFVPELRHIIAEAKGDKTKRAGAERVGKLLDEILSRPEHAYPSGLKKH